jgi:hypothetical protein
MQKAELIECMRMATFHLPISCAEFALTSKPRKAELSRIVNYWFGDRRVAHLTAFHTILCATPVIFALNSCHFYERLVRLHHCEKMI